MTNKNVGYTKITFELLKEMLQLEDEINILDVKSEDSDRDNKYFRIFIESKAIPEREEGKYFPNVELLGATGKKTKVLIKGGKNDNL